MPQNKTTKRRSKNSLVKLIDNGWDIHITNQVRRLSVMGRWTFTDRVCWEAINNNDSYRGYKKESRWEGFDTAPEAIKDLLKKVK